MLTDLYDGGWRPPEYQLPFARGPPVVLLDRELAQRLLGERWRDLPGRLIAFGWQHPLYAPAGLIVMVTETWDELTRPGAVTADWWQRLADHETRHLREGWEHSGHAADETWLVNGLPASLRVGHVLTATPRTPTEELPVAPGPSMGAGSGGPSGGSPPAIAGDGDGAHGDGAPGARAHTHPAGAKQKWSPIQARAPPSGGQRSSARAGGALPVAARVVGTVARGIGAVLIGLGVLWGATPGQALAAQPLALTQPVTVARDGVVPDQGAPGQHRVLILRGDSLSGLARALNLSERDILAVNPGSAAHPNLIRAGDRLVLPANWDGTWRVRPGDTLSTIAGRFGRPVTVGGLADASGVANPDRIWPGQRVVVAAVPTAPQPAPKPGGPPAPPRPGGLPTVPNTGSPSPGPVVTAPPTVGPPMAPGPNPGSDWVTSVVGGLMVLAVLAAKPVLKAVRGGLGRLGTALRTVGGRLGGGWRATGRRAGARWRAVSGWAGAGWRVVSGWAGARWRAASGWAGGAATWTAGAGRRIGGRIGRATRQRYRAAWATGVGLGFGGGVVAAVGEFGPTGVIIGGAVAAAGAVTAAVALWSSRLARGPPAVLLAAAATVAAAGLGIGALVWGDPVGAWLAAAEPLSVLTTVAASVPSAVLTYRYVLRRQVNNLLGGLERNPRGDALRSAVLAFSISATYGVLSHAGIVGSLVFGALVAIASSAVQRKDTGRTRTVKALVAGMMAGPVAWLGGALAGLLAPELGTWVATTLGTMAAVAGTTAIADYAAAGYLNWLDKQAKKQPKSNQLLPRAKRWAHRGRPGRFLGGLLDRILGAPRGVALERRSSPDSQVLTWKSVDPILAALLSWLIKGWEAVGHDTPGTVATRVAIAAGIWAVTTVVRDWKEYRRGILGYSGARKLRQPRRIGLVAALWVSGRGRLTARLAQFDRRVTPLLRHRRGSLPGNPAEWAAALDEVAEELATALATATVAPTPWWESFVRDNPTVVPAELLDAYRRLTQERNQQHPVAIAHAVATVALSATLLAEQAARLRADGRLTDADLLAFAADLATGLAAHPVLVPLATPAGMTPGAWHQALADATPPRRVRMVTTELARQLDKRDALRAELMRLEKSILRAIMTNYPTSGPQAGEQGPLARARRELFVVRVGLAREAARGKNLGQDTAGQPALAAHLDALSQVAELFDQRGRSVRDSETPRAAPRTALAVLEALADLAGEVALSGRGRAATHRSWTTGATTALATPLTRPYTPLWALWRIIGRDGTITAAALSAQFDGRDHRLSWWSDTLATWHRLGALTDAGTGAYRVAPPLRALWVAVGPRIRAAARANVTALPGGSALDPLTGDRLDPTDPATAAAYAELTRLLDAAALARRWWRDGWVDDARATLTRWRDARGHRAGRVDAYPSPDRPGALSRTGRAAAEVGTIAWTRWHAAYTHRQRLRRLVNQALVATRERRRLVRAVAPGPIAPNQLAPILRASQIEADAYGALAHGYVAAHTALTSADAYPHVTERTLRRARAALDSGPGSDPTKLSVAQRLRQIRHELRTATRVLNRAAWPSTEDRDNALRAAALALERAQLAQDDAFRTKLHQTVGGWRRMEAARRATDALWLTYQNELALGGPPTSPIVPARTGIIPPSDDPVDEAAAQAPGAAALTRRGRDHHRNQDAAGVAGTPTRTDAVLTDGLSNTAASERAAYRGAATGLAALTHQPTLDPVTAIRHAYRAAATAITAGRVGAATWLAARVVRDRPGEAVLSYGWVGDSRAYWLPAPGTGAPELLTTDHAVVYNPFGARADTDALTRWLAPYYRPELATDTRRVTGPGLLVLVTDGVWGQLAEPSRLAEALSPTAYTDPTLAATELADAARDRDPDDDTTVVVIRVDGDPGR